MLLDVNSELLVLFHLDTRQLLKIGKRNVSQSPRRNVKENKSGVEQSVSRSGVLTFDGDPAAASAAFSGVLWLSIMIL